MRIIVPKEVESIINESDIKYMLKASGKDDMYLHKDEYEPTANQIREFLVEAYSCELKKNRPVSKWKELLSKLA